MLILLKDLKGNFLNGPPEAVIVIDWNEPWSLFNKWKIELCSESSGTIIQPLFLACFDKFSPSEIMHSLFATPIFLPDLHNL